MDNENDGLQEDRSASMTYCVGMLLDTGLVFLSDSRTSAGVDQISTFRKTLRVPAPGERGVRHPDRRQPRDHPGHDEPAARADRSARYHARACSRARTCSKPRVASALHCVRPIGATPRRSKEFGVEFNANLILGGQIRGEPPRLFSIYAAGNFIEATPDTSYFQIGESKYGKPIIDRVIRRSSSLNEAAKAALVSMDSTIRSNLSVGLPLDLVIVKRDRLEVARHINIDSENEYFHGLRDRWSDALREAFVQLPEPDWLRNPLT